MNIGASPPSRPGGFDPPAPINLPGRVPFSFLSWPLDRKGGAVFIPRGLPKLKVAPAAAAATSDSPEDAQKEVIHKKVDELEIIYRGTSNENTLSEEAKNALAAIAASLEGKGQAYAVGAVLREVAKSLYSRWVVEAEFKENEPFLLLWNAVEESRTGNMLKSQYPGANEFLRAAYREDFSRDQKLWEDQQKIIDIIRREAGASKEEAEKIARESGFVEALPKHVQFVKGILYEFLSGKKIDWNDPNDRPKWISDPETVAALAKTASAYRDASRAKEPLFGKTLPEKKVAEYALESYKDVRDKLWPVYKELVEKDKQEMEKKLNNKEQGQGSQKDSRTESDKNEKDGKTGGKKDEAEKKAEKIIREIDKMLSGELETKNEEKKRGGKEKESDPGAGVPLVPGEKHTGTSAEGPEEPGEAVSGSGNPGAGTTSDIEQLSYEELLRLKRLSDAASSQSLNDYQRLLAEVFQQSEDLSGRISNLFEKNSRPRYIRGKKKPGVVDMPSVVAAAARASRGEIDPEPPIYKRREEPKKRDHAVVILVDHSGSMTPDKMEQANKAWIMAAEAFEKNHVPWALMVFSDHHAIVKDFGDSWDDQSRQRALTRIDNFEQSGTNDAKAVRPCLEMIEARNPQGVRLILPITDGQGETDEMKKTVEEADSKGISIIGVGIDQAMEYIKKVYIHHAFAVNMESLPSVLATAIQQRFEAAYES